MQPILTIHKNAIANVCSLFGVKKMYAFGSAVREDFHEHSDVDFLVEFAMPDKDPIKAFDIYLQFKNQLEQIVSRKVDVLQMNEITNPYLRHFINQEKQLVYG